MIYPVNEHRVCECGTPFVTAKDSINRLCPDCQKGWLSGKIQCDICTHNWIAVYNERCQRLECPHCERMVTFTVINQYPEES